MTRLRIIGRFFARIIGLTIGIIFLAYLALLNYDESISHIDLGVTSVKKGTIADARANPGVLYVETLPGYSCAGSVDNDGKVTLTLNYGYSTEKAFDGIKLHLFVDDIVHEKSEFEKLIYNNATAEQKATIDKALLNSLRINFTSKIIRDFGYNASHYPSRMMVNGKYYSFTTEDGKEVPAQVTNIYSESLNDVDKAYEVIKASEGYLLTLTLGATSDIMTEETSVLGNSNIVFDGYLETSIDYKALGIDYSIFDTNTEVLIDVLVREIKQLGVLTIVLVLLIFSSLWAIPSTIKDFWDMAKDGFDTLKREGLGRAVRKWYVINGGQKEYVSTDYENDGLFTASVILVLLIPFSPAFAIIKSVVTIFTDAYCFFAC